MTKSIAFSSVDSYLGGDGTLSDASLITGSLQWKATVPDPGDDKGRVC